ncbi:polysaccharide biosynthesis protein [Bacteroidales bacterium OttesenSCG-928-C03]|nr:polysaccharide biosynthesis protein [Bacteroidales bacterium OttesenSCG-928-C03]MDL2325553.1 polysaccharide biosynthesis protein [Bacteroidales bacterium OttesenSCG-928-A14]
MKIVSLFIQKLKIMPAWFVLVIDLLVTLFSCCFAIVIRENFHIPAHFSMPEFIIIISVILVMRLFSFLAFKTPLMVVRFTNTKDVAKIFTACFSTSIFLFIINVISYLISARFVIPTSILIMEFFITTFIMVFYRLAFKSFYLETVNPTKSKKNIVIFGAGEAGLTTKRALDRDTSSKYNVQAFFDDDMKKVGKKVENINVYSSSQLDNYLEKNNTSFLIIAILKLSPSKRAQITDIALRYNVKVLLVPPVTRWINGELSFKQIKKVKIEDLLEREPIVLDQSLIKKELDGKVILITGAAGSIGSEIVRQLMNFNYRKLILVDNAETPTFYLYNECMAKNKLNNIEIEIASIIDKEKMEMIMEHYRPELIYHAAAYKHVPMMECNVNAAIKVNVEGTKSLADLAVKYGAEKFVMISTDKAVNPSTVMGASKRIAEIYVQSLNYAQATTKFVTTRFGNVLGSNGSVIPIFRKQIEEGGPVTVTDPDVNRYFMTIPEACQLVINAGAMGNGGEIYIFDMGESVKIIDLATKMIRLSGLELGKDIQIQYTGLRPGEKLYEELLANQENTIPTHNQKIMIAQVRTYEYEKITEKITELIAIKNNDPQTIVGMLKEIVPEYESRNREFEG